MISRSTTPNANGDPLVNDDETMTEPSRSSPSLIVPRVDGRSRARVRGVNVPDRGELRRGWSERRGTLRVVGRSTETFVKMSSTTFEPGCPVVHGAQ